MLWKVGKNKKERNRKMFKKEKADIEGKTKKNAAGRKRNI